MKTWLWNGFFKAKNQLKHFLKDETGETNIIAIILIVIVVIAVVAIFRNRLIEIVNDLFDKIREQMDI